MRPISRNKAAIKNWLDPFGPSRQTRYVTVGTLSVPGGGDR